MFTVIFFSRSNLSNRLNFASLTEGDIDQVEQSVREEGIKLVEKKLQFQDEENLYEKQLVDYFGETYASDPSNFRFEIGDKKLIRIVRDHIVEQQSVKGAKYMRRFRKKSDRENQKKIKLNQHKRK